MGRPKKSLAVLMRVSQTDRSKLNAMRLKGEAYRETITRVIDAYNGGALTKAVKTKAVCTIAQRKTLEAIRLANESLSQTLARVLEGHLKANPKALKRAIAAHDSWSMLCGNAALTKEDTEEDDDLAAALHVASLV